MVRLTDRPDMTLDVYRGRKTTIQHTTKYVRDQAWFVHLYGEIILELERGVIDRTGAQIMLYLTCTMICSVDLAHYGVSPYLQPQEYLSHTIWCFNGHKDMSYTSLRTDYLSSK